jgi:hypothetical protein
MTVINKAAQPGVNELHIDHFLTDIAISWVQDESKFVAGQVFPTVPVVAKSDYYPIYPKGYFYRDEFAVRPYGGRPKKIGYKVEKGHYFCDEEAVEIAIDDRERANYDVASLDPDIAAQRVMRTQAMIHRDRLWAAEYFKAGVWATNWTGLEKAPTHTEETTEEKFLQFDQAGSEPIEFFDQRRIDVESKTGYEPNILVIGKDVFRVLKNHPAIVERIKYTQKGIVTAEILAELFDVDKVLIPGGVINEAAEGLATAINFIVNRKAALLVYAAPAPSIAEPSAGYSFAWTGLLPGQDNAFGGVIERGREELAKSDILQCRTAFTQAVTASDLGEFFAECVTT